MPVGRVSQQTAAVGPIDQELQTRHDLQYEQELEKLRVQQRVLQQQELTCSRSYMQRQHNLAKGQLW